MKQLFDNVSERCSKITTTIYSTSFSLGTYFLNARLRKSIYAIYGFVRFADEIVDSFENYNKPYLLKKFKADTEEALEHKISLNPILNSFQHAVTSYNIDRKLIDTFLQSMEMDLNKINYTQENYQQYILGSAEVVGLMCLHVFTEGDLKSFEELKPSAMKLGAAFQKVNFLRDLGDDFNVLDRTYFPNVSTENFTIEEKKVIEQEIEMDFKEALKGIKKLPHSSKLGVYLAYTYYRSLFKKIKTTPPKQLLVKRIRITNTHKLLLMFQSMINYKMNII